MLNNRPMSRAIALPAAIVTLAFLGLTACSDDGGSTRSASASASGSGSGSGTGSGTAGDASGSGSGISIAPDASTDDPQVQEAAAQYTQYVRGQVDQLLTDTKVFTDAVRDGDVEAAKAAFAPSRQAWERIEPIAGLVEDIDGSVDARVDDFESPDDPAGRAGTGWSTCCGRRATSGRTRVPRSWPTSWTPTWPSSRPPSTRPTSRPRRSRPARPS